MWPFERIEREVSYLQTQRNCACGYSHFSVGTLPDTVSCNSCGAMYYIAVLEPVAKYAYDKRVPELQSDGTIIIRDNQTGQGFDLSTGKKVSN